MPAVSIRLFWLVLKRYKLRFKEKAVDQCAKCNVLRANIMKAAPADRPALSVEWVTHNEEADKGHNHRSKLIEQCQSVWAEVDLHHPNSASFPPQPPTVAIGVHAIKLDAAHGVVCRRGAGLQLQVASTKEWSEEVCAKAREGEQATNSTFMDKSCFRRWKEHLSQMHHANPSSSTGEKHRVLDHHWANFGWGRSPNGKRKFHPHEVWLHTGKGDSMEEWCKETPVAVVFAKKCEKGWFQAKQADANRSVDYSKRPRI